MQRPVAARGARLVSGLIAAAVLLGASAALSAVPSAESAGPPRVVNLTSDSAPGWIPSLDQGRTARKAALDYLAAKDSGSAAQAYALLTDGEQHLEPFADFSRQLISFNTKAGAVVERRIVTVTWTKDPAQAPAPGVYAAIDLVSRFANIDRGCGYLVLYQAPAGGDFRVTREEENFLDNATAKTMTLAEVDENWFKLSANCPNYPGNSALVAAAQPPAPLPEAQGSTIGYPTVEAALADLHSRPGVVFSTQQGWTIASDEASETFWSFPPEGNPAYPAAVKRQVVKQGDGVALKMNILCGASKSACDDLVRSFEQLNAQMEAEIRGAHSTAGPAPHD